MAGIRDLTNQNCGTRLRVATSDASKLRIEDGARTTLRLHWSAVSAMQRPATIWHMLPQIAMAQDGNLDSRQSAHRQAADWMKHFLTAIRETRTKRKCLSVSRTAAHGKSSAQTTTTPSSVLHPLASCFSEWSRANPASWAYLAPILVENNGWALFITTPLGNNHAKAMYDMARNDPAWFAEISTVADTQAISHEAVEAQRREYHALFGDAAGDALIEQEYYCSFSSVIPGSYYAKEMTEAERDKRICASRCRSRSARAFRLGLGRHRTAPRSGASKSTVKSCTSWTITKQADTAQNTTANG